jgi:hypothetical protein
MDYSQLREILVNTEALYNLWQSTGLDEEAFIRANGKLIEQTEKARLQKEQARARQVKFFEKKKSEGKRFLSAMVSASTYDNLCRLRDNSIQSGSPKNLGEVLDELLSGSQPKQAIVETQTEIPAPAQTLAQDQAADKPDTIKIIAAHRAAGQTWPAIAKELNSQGILTARGGAWTGPNCQTFFKRSQK